MQYSENYIMWLELIDKSKRNRDKKFWYPFCVKNH